MTASMVPRLTMKWVFGLAGVSSARAQPGFAVFVADGAANAYAIDADTGEIASGAMRWSFQPQAGDIWVGRIGH